jgi:EAL domain-containing protein (putative c-di-GMP-specific phosphodiesterase class I)
VQEAFDRSGVDPSTITFEITESAVIDNLTAAIEFASGIQRIGCKLALDDFGTGYASLSTLKYLPIDLVKIDGEFITGLRRSSLNKAIVRAVVGLCRELGIRTAAEFVPDDETIDLLRDYGVDHAQGYAIGRPVPMASTHPAARVPTPLLDRATG